MADAETLGSPPSVTVEVVADRSRQVEPGQGFLRVRHLTLRSLYPDGSRSEPFDYDVVERDAMDAVGIVLEGKSPAGPTICLRSALRPPLALRPGYAVPDAEAVPRPVLWEVPAGLVEPGEEREGGLLECASRETLEEVGLEVPAADFEPLGPPATLSPGVMGEKVHFLLAAVDPGRRRAPTEDGSVVERGAEIRFVPVDEALRAARDGRVADAKTEVAIRRLAELRGIT